MRTRPLPEPNGCTYCGVGEREHAGRWTAAAGWHQYAAPTGAQILARMRARRDARNTPPAPPEPRTALNPAQPETVHSDAPASAHRPSQAVSREDTPR